MYCEHYFDCKNYKKTPDLEAGPNMVAIRLTHETQRKRNKNKNVHKRFCSVLGMQLTKLLTKMLE
jgi:hypothetical protein